MRDTLLRQVNIIRGLDEDRYVWPHVMDEISRALPQYTWLTTLGFTGAPQGATNVVAAPKDSAKIPQGRGEARASRSVSRPRSRRTRYQIRIKGRTVDIQAFTRFMKDLEASPFFCSVQLDKVGAGDRSGQRSHRSSS